MQKDEKKSRLNFLNRPKISKQVIQVAAILKVNPKDIKETKILNLMLEEWNIGDAIKYNREEAREEDLEQGLEQGTKNGMIYAYYTITT